MLVLALARASMGYITLDPGNALELWSQGFFTVVLDVRRLDEWEGLPGQRGMGHSNPPPSSPQSDEATPAP